MKTVRSGIQQVEAMQREDPDEYQFNDTDRERYSERFCKLSRRLVLGGEWAKAWRPGNAQSGGGAVASILPVLMLQVWPGAKTEIRTPLKVYPGFTPWVSLSVRRIGKVAGVGRTTAWRSMRSLEQLGWAYVRTLGSADPQGGRRTWFCLSEKLWDSELGMYAPVHGHLIYSGTWAMLPTAAARHLYLALSALDPIHHEAGLRLSMEEQSQECDEQDERIQKLRKRSSITISGLSELTGICRRALPDALAILESPVGVPPNLKRMIEKQTDGERTWYVVNRDATAGWHFTTALLNATPERIEAARRSNWTCITRRPGRTRKRWKSNRKHRRAA